MKKLLAIILTLVLLIGAAPLAVFAGGGNDFPDEPCANQGDPLRPEGSFTFTLDGEDHAYVDFYSGSAGFYLFESSTNNGADVMATVYDSEGTYLAYGDDTSYDDLDFRIICYVDYKTDVFIYVGNWSADAAQVKITATLTDIQDVEIVEFPNKTDYRLNETSPDLGGLTYKITYKNGDTALWKPDLVQKSPDGVFCEASFTDEIKPGENHVSLRAYGIRQDYSVDFSDYRYDSAAVVTMPDRTDYIVGVDNYDFDPTGMVIRLYDHGEEYMDICFDGSYEMPMFVESIEYPDEYALGDNKVTVNFAGGVTAELTVTGVENYVDSIELTKLPDKTEYTVYEDYSESVNMKGAQIRINFTDGTHDYFDVGDSYYFNGRFIHVTLQNGWRLNEGANTVEVSYCEKTCAFTAYGVPTDIENIELMQWPDRTVYYGSNAMLDLDGMVMNVNYKNGSYDTYTFANGSRVPNGSGSVFDYVDAWTEESGYGHLKVNVSFRGFMTYFYADFYESNVTRVTVARDPDRTRFPEHSILMRDDLNGLKLNVYRSDGTSEVWDYAENGGYYNGFDAFGDYVRNLNNSGDFAVVLDIGGYDAIVYLTVSDFSILEYEVVKEADAAGSNAVIKFTPEGGAPAFTATFPAVFNPNDFAEGYIEVNGDKFPYSVVRNVNGEDNMPGIIIYIFDLQIFVPCGEGGGGLKGDMDGDGEITVADALRALRIAAKLVAPTEQDIELGDVDNDGEITVADALKILRVAAKLADRSSLG